MRAPPATRSGVLTNDGVGINGTDFFAGIPEFQALDAFVDARAGGSAKPDPEPYLRAADELDVEPARVVFLDDTQACIDGAERVGMTAVRVNPIDKRPAFALDSFAARPVADNGGMSETRQRATGSSVAADPSGAGVPRHQGVDRQGLRADRRGGPRRGASWRRSARRGCPAIRAG